VNARRHVWKNFSSYSDFCITIHEWLIAACVFYFKFLEFLANVNSRSRSLYAVARLCRLSVLSVCNAHAPYSAG